MASVSESFIIAGGVIFTTSQIDVDDTPMLLVRDLLLVFLFSSFAPSTVILPSLEA